LLAAHTLLTKVVRQLKGRHFDFPQPIMEEFIAPASVITFNALEMIPELLAGAIIGSVMRLDRRMFS
jgi:hypothetical protein